MSVRMIWKLRSHDHHLSSLSKPRDVYLWSQDWFNYTILKQLPTISKIPFFTFEIKTWKVLPVVPEYAEMRQTYCKVTSIEHYNDVMDGRAAVRIFYLSHRLVEVCEINRINHWCSLGTVRSHPSVHHSSGKPGLPSFPLNDGLGG